MNIILPFYALLFRKFQGNSDSTTDTSTWLFCFLPFTHYTLLKLRPCYKKKEKCLKKISLLEQHRLLQLLETALSATIEFTIEFDKILVRISLPYYASP